MQGYSAHCLQFLFAELTRTTRVVSLLICDELAVAFVLAEEEQVDIPFFVWAVGKHAVLALVDCEAAVVVQG